MPDFHTPGHATDGPVDSRGHARTTPVEWFLPMNTRLALPNPIRYAVQAFASGALFRME
jgi:hypothetical protein